MDKNQLNTILIHYSEIGLKGKNQPYFRRLLKQNIKAVLRSMKLDWPVSETRGHLYVTVSQNQDMEPVLKNLQQVFGVAWLSPALKVSLDQGSLPASHDMNMLKEHLVEMARGIYSDGKTFCIRVKRSDKSLPFRSSEFERILGDLVREQTPWYSVDLSNPDVTFSLEFHPEYYYLFCDRRKGRDGLPVGASGRVLALLSGGIDSPVAAYLMARRGCEVDFLHFTATSLQQQEAENYKVTRIARHLSKFTLRSRLYLVPYTYFDVALLGKKIPYDLIVFRRFMARVAEKLAGQINAEAIVTGDNLAQVASQTLSNIVSTSRSVDLPILRPLLAYSKNEIIELATRINTYDTSIESYKDCCSLIASHPRTKSEHARLNDLEESVLPGYPALIDQTLADMICMENVLQ